MRTLRVIINPGEEESFSAVGDYVRLKVGAVALRLQNEESGTDAEIEQGDALNLKRFSSLRLSHSSGLAQTFVLLIGDGESADSAKVGGSVDVTSIAGRQGAYSESTIALTGFVTTQIVAANPNRRILSVHCRITSASSVFISLTGVQAIADGMELQPGDTIFIDEYPPTGAVTALSTQNAFLYVVQG